MTLTPPKKGIFWGKRQAKKQRLARFFEKSVVENVRHFVFINGYLSFFVCNNQAESFVNRGVLSASAGGIGSFNVPAVTQLNE